MTGRTFRHFGQWQGRRNAIGVGKPPFGSRSLPSGTLQSVPCPTCGAVVGERCKTSGTHVDRRRMAIRAMQQTNESPTTQGETA